MIGRIAGAVMTHILQWNLQLFLLTLLLLLNIIKLLIDILSKYDCSCSSSYRNNNNVLLVSPVNLQFVIKIKYVLYDLRNIKCDL
jgi:hypothetical protein